jgi:hypothetical protein
LKVAEEPSELRRIIEETDWKALEDDDVESWSDLDTPALLQGLTSGDVRLVEAGLKHLSFGLIEYPNVFPAAGPAIQYVLALLPGSHIDDALRPALSGVRRPLRAHLLHWLRAVVDAVSDDMERKFVDLAGFSPLEDPTSTWHRVRQLRPQIFDVVSTFLEDPDPFVRREAIAAAVVLVRVPELAVHRDVVAASTQAFLDAATDPGHREWAATTLDALR